MESKFSNRNTNETIKGMYYVTYRARNKYNGKMYETVHLNPIGNSLNPNEAITTADKVNDYYQEKYKGICPFNGRDTEFEVIRIQQRR